MYKDQPDQVIYVSKKNIQTCLREVIRVMSYVLFLVTVVWHLYSSRLEVCVKSKFTCKSATHTALKKIEI